MTAFDIKRIKQIVENIEKKMNIVLKTPFKMAVDFLNSALNSYIHGMYEETFEYLD